MRRQTVAAAMVVMLGGCDALLQMQAKGWKVSPPKVLLEAAAKQQDDAPEFVPVPPSDAKLMLVTIGPQCAGKTTMLSEDGLADVNGAIVDVALDNHPDVYYKVPREQFTRQEAIPPAADVELFGAPLSARIGERTSLGDSEMRAVLLRMAQQLSQAEFRTSLAEVVADKELREQLDGLVEDRLAASVDPAADLPDRVDLFVREALGEVAIRTQTGALRRAAGGPRHVAWGNTNTNARDYTAALKCAEESGRSVKFVRWGHELPVVPTKELLRRNLERLAKTGRYIPVETIASFRKRTDNLMKKSNNGDPLLLAGLSGYTMDEHGRVARDLRKGGGESRAGRHGQSRKSRR